MPGRTHGKTTEIVLLEIKEHHPDLIYDKFTYVNCNTKITLGCKIHGYFSKYPNDMKRGRGGCPKCKNSWDKTDTEFRQEIIQQFPYISYKGEYKNSKTNLEFFCSIHNQTFISVPYSVAQGHLGCLDCRTDRQQKTKLIRGQVGDPKLKSDYENYRREVWKFSNRTYRTMMKGQIRDRHNHLDHILSIVEGFAYKVKPEIMGSIHNLRIISGKLNRMKSYKSEITVDQLLGKYCT